MSRDGVTMGGAAGGCLHELFERQAAVRGDAVAVAAPDERLSYAALDRRANRLAHRLRSLGVGPEVVVGVHTERSARLVVALLAVLKAGGAYLPLDPAHPRERLASLLADAGAAVLVTDADEPLPGAHHVVVLRSGEPPGDGPATLPAAGVEPRNLAYVIYTSGSTGTPKGVMVEHRNVTRLFTSTRDLFHFGADDVWTLFHSAAFDFSVWEIWGALLHGGRLVVVPRDVSRSPEEFHALLDGERVTVLNQTPAAFRQLVRIDEERGGAGLGALRWVVFGGEALGLETLRPWFARRGDARPALVNMYGITETTVHVTHRPLTAADPDTAPGSMIGRPLPDLSAHVAPDGELYVGGAGVARGYLGRPGLTAERFAPDPDSAEPGARRYRTGDRVRVRAGADLEYLGRADQQVKIRGHRIEPGEIEAALLAHPAVREAVVHDVPDAAGDSRLVAYWVGAGTEAGELRDHLERTLPEYMVPAAFLPLDRIPLTPNGKVDRTALPAPEAARTDGPEGFAAPETPLQKELAGIWAEVLSVEQIGLDDDFFELGGHSILATRAAAEARDRLGVPATLRLMFDEPTVRGFAAALTGEQAG